MAGGKKSFDFSDVTVSKEEAQKRLESLGLVAAPTAKKEEPPTPTVAPAATRPAPLRQSPPVKRVAAQKKVEAKVVPQQPPIILTVFSSMMF